MWGRAATAQHVHHYQISGSVSDMRCSKVSAVAPAPVVDHWEPLDPRRLMTMSERRAFNLFRGVPLEIEE